MFFSKVRSEVALLSGFDLELRYKMRFCYTVSVNISWRHRARRCVPSGGCWCSRRRSLSTPRQWSGQSLTEPDARIRIRLNHWFLFRNKIFWDFCVFTSWNLHLSDNWVRDNYLVKSVEKQFWGSGFGVLNLKQREIFKSLLYEYFRYF